MTKPAQALMESFDTATITAEEYYARAAALKLNASALERKFFAMLTGQILLNHKDLSRFDIPQMVEDLAALARDRDAIVAGEARWQIIEYTQTHGWKSASSAAVFVTAQAEAKKPFNANAARPRPSHVQAQAAQRRGGPEL